MNAAGLDALGSNLSVGDVRGFSEAKDFDERTEVGSESGLQ